MTRADLEKVYEALVIKIDEVGAEKSEMFLAKLALLLAQQSGDVNAFLACVDSAAESMD
jgi:hypothetical protein